MNLTNGWEQASEIQGSPHHYVRRNENGDILGEVVQWVTPRTWYKHNKHMISIFFTAGQGIEVPDHIENCEQAMEYANALHRLEATE